MAARRLVARFLVAVLVVASVASVVFATASAAGGPTTPPTTLRMLTFNMHAGINAAGTLDLAGTARTINGSGADVVALQEVDVHWSARSEYVDQAAELAKLTGMRVFFAPIYDLEPESGKEHRRQYGVAVLSRFPIVHANNHELTRESTVDGSIGPMPGFGEVVLDVAGSRVSFFVTHLDFRPDPAIRQRQVAETVDILATLPPGRDHALAGDFNAAPSAPELAPLFAREHDAWAQVHGAADGYTYPAQQPNTRIDYVTSSGQATKAEVISTHSSDHLPVLAHITWP